MPVGYDPDRTREIMEMIDGHDSRPIALSDSDRIVKDADELFRYDPSCMSIDMQRFGIEACAYIPWLADRIAPWFFKETAERIARNEAETYKKG